MAVAINLELALQTAGGEPIALAELVGRPLVLVFLRHLT